MIYQVMYGMFLFLLSFLALFHGQLIIEMPSGIIGHFNTNDLPIIFWWITFMLGFNAMLVDKPFSLFTSRILVPIMTLVIGKKRMSKLDERLNKICEKWNS